MNKNIVVSVVAFLSAVFAIMFVEYLSIDPNVLTNTSNDEYISQLSKLEFLWILTSADFWNLPYWQLLSQPQEIDALINVFSTISLGIFCTGLFIYHHYLNQLSREYIGLLFLLMGWAHVALSKIVLMYDLPVLLTGPVLAVGLISLLYFSITAFLLSTSYLIWKVKQ